MDAAVTPFIAVATFPPKSTFMDETTLSLAINPVISDVTMRQSPSPTGFRSGAIPPANSASMLSCESLTRLKCMSKLCRNHTTMVAISMTENAL